ncbi:MAG: nicotinate-nucleotide adenylyltransferase [Chloroflexota bacterium]|jgi:nicotinate-nucleotide adenylyltransferase|nr:nicotinate-nucleotide adenylyltransferase [Chloroflexota bacterium]
MAIRRSGILGGTFDPVHLAHLAIAQQAVEELGLESVLFVPAGMPPHKGDQIVTPVAHRVAMVELAIAGNACFRLSRIEVERPGPSYAVDTLAQLTSEGGALEGQEPVFILSAEALRGLPTWHEPDRFLSLCRVAVAPRLGYAPPQRSWLEEHFPGRADRFTFLRGPDLGHSASDIRHRASEGRSIRYLVPDAVAAYITRNRLYPPELWAKN